MNASCVTRLAVWPKACGLNFFKLSARRRVLPRSRDVLQQLITVSYIDKLWLNSMPASLCTMTLILAPGICPARATKTCKFFHSKASKRDAQSASLGTVWMSSFDLRFQHLRAAHKDVGSLGSPQPPFLHVLVFLSSSSSQSAARTPSAVCLLSNVLTTTR